MGLSLGENLPRMHFMSSGPQLSQNKNIDNEQVLWFLERFSVPCQWDLADPVTLESFISVSIINPFKVGL